jgi:hypothetical protein
MRTCTCDAGGPGWETCYGDVPAVWGSCECNGVPIANAGSDRSVSYRTHVVLDGRLSKDPEGQPLQFHWTLDAVPAGSTAALDSATIATPVFVPDVPGDYGVSLAVDDMIATSPPAHVTISAHNDAPTLLAAVPANVITGTTITIDASATTDPNSDPLTFAWTVTGPQGSTAAPADPTASKTTFVADLDGTYQVSLAVDDGRLSSGFTSTVQSYHRVTALSFVPWRAVYDKTHDRIVFISQDPTNAMYVYDTATNTAAMVPLPQMPGELSVSPDGSRATAGNNGSLMIVNLTTMAVTSTVAVSSGASSLVDPGNGWVYAFPSIGLPAYIRDLKLSTGVVGSGAQVLYPDMRAHWMPGTTNMYATDSTFTVVYSYTNGFTTLTKSASSIGTELWISDDGTRVFSYNPPVYAADLTQVGQLRGAVTGVSESSATGTLVAIPASGATGNGNESVDVYAYPALTYDHSVPLPPEIKNGMTYATHGYWIFMHADGVHYSVVVQVSSTEFAVTTL